MAEIKKLQVDGADIYPVTHESAVYDNEGKSIESKYLSSVAYTEGDDIKIDTSELEAKIEEVEETANWCRTALGDGSQLLTNNKNTVVEAINEVFQCGNNVKQNLVDALIAKGVQASTSETFDSLIAKLNDIQSSNNPYNIITASRLPATGEENQLCVLTSEASSEFYFNASTATVPSNAITFVCISGRDANYSVTSDNVTTHYNISYSEQNGTVRPVYLYKNGQWISVALANTSLIENGIINSGVNNFYNVDPSYDQYWKYTQGTGLYTAGTANSYYSSVTTTQTINFDKYNSIQVTGYIDSSSTSGLALFKSDSVMNQLHSTENYLTITDYQRFNITSTTFTYDITSWSGSGYLGLLRYNSDATKIYITDIKLMMASNPGEDSGDTSEFTSYIKRTTGTVTSTDADTTYAFSESLSIPYYSIPLGSATDILGLELYGEITQDDIYGNYQTRYSLDNINDALLIHYCPSSFESTSGTLYTGSATPCAIEGSNLILPATAPSSTLTYTLFTEESNLVSNITSTIYSETISTSSSVFVTTASSESRTLSYMRISRDNFDQIDYMTISSETSSLLTVYNSSNSYVFTSWHVGNGSYTGYRINLNTSDSFVEIPLLSTEEVDTEYQVTIQTFSKD